MAFILSFLFILGSAGASHSCSCPEDFPAPPIVVQVQYAAKISKAVFSGQVLAIEKSGKYSARVKIRVEKLWKGILKDTYTVSTALISASCGYSFKVGEKYLVYAFADGTDDKLQVSSCSRTKLLTKSGWWAGSAGRRRNPWTPIKNTKPDKLTN